LTCSQCGAVFNEKFHDVTIDTPCPRCGSELTRRDDDTEDALERRLAQFREQTLPVAHHYRKKGLLKEVDATDGRDAVFTRLYVDFHQEVLV
jgi:adenylate kinase